MDKKHKEQLNNTLQHSVFSFFNQKTKFTDPYDKQNAFLSEISSNKL